MSVSGYELNRLCLVRPQKLNRQFHVLEMASKMHFSRTKYNRLEFAERNIECLIRLSICTKYAGLPSGNPRPRNVPRTLLLDRYLGWRLLGRTNTHATATCLKTYTPSMSFHIRSDCCTIVLKRDNVTFLVMTTLWSKSQRKLIQICYHNSVRKDIA